jgi:hypothetical protein
MTKTKFRPMLFSTPMVQDLLDGRKTMTRRTKGLEQINENPNQYRYDGVANDENDSYYGCHYFEYINTKYPPETYHPVEPSMCVGDVIWVRETFRPIGQDKWKPSLFMPKQACRIFLKIKSIRAERLQHLSKADAIAEGVKKDANFGYECYLCNKQGHKAAENLCEDGFFCNPFDSFKTLWISINGQESWDLNPFVWVYKFERIDKPLDFIV